MMYREFNILVYQVSSVFDFRKKIIKILNYIHKNLTHFMHFRFLRKLGHSCILLESMTHGVRVIDASITLATYTSHENGTCVLYSAYL